MATWYGIVLVVALCLIIIGIGFLLCFRQCFKCKRADDVIASEEGRSRFVFTIPLTGQSSLDLEIIETAPIMFSLVIGGIQQQASLEHLGQAETTSNKFIGKLKITDPDAQDNVLVPPRVIVHVFE